MEPFNRVQLTEEEYVLLRAIIFCHSFTDGLSKQGRELLLNESEKYSKILMKILQVCDKFMLNIMDNSQKFSISKNRTVFVLTSRNHGNRPSSLMLL
uniref:NR LBD domain-containing protein n=1 Tax=Meloidogyne incognita TaxID=6306 RepID=A0A914M5J6_MELIC